MKRTLYCLLTLLLLMSNKSFSQKTEAFKWLTGTWKINTSNGALVEQWKITNDSTLTGKSFFTRNGTDTIPQETVELAYRDGNWYYIPTVKAQNNNEPVKFMVIFLKGTEFISENTTHDFPQKIAYRRIKQQLFASIEGKKNGMYDKQHFDFTAE